MEFSATGIAVRELKSLLLSSSPMVSSAHVRRAIQLAQTSWLSGKNWLPTILSGNTSKEVVKRVKGFDLAFYPWPFMLEFPELACPSVGVFHDFNYKYYFGGSFAFSPSQRNQLEREMPVCLPM